MAEENIYQYKSYLFKIAYNMLGDIAASEDLVQDTFEKWLTADRSEVGNTKAYLSRMLINKAIDKLEQLKKERAVYKGLWMPEPILSDTPSPDGEPTIEYAVLFLLEKLNPQERAVFVLKEVFATPHNELAEFLQLSSENCRQLLHRAKEKVRSTQKREKAEADRHKELLQAFLAAAYNKDFVKLREILREDVILYSDGGGKKAAALKPLYGTSKVLKFLEGIMNLDPDAEFSVRPVFINSREGILLYRNSEQDTVIYIDTEADTIRELFFLRNPDKIKLKDLNAG